MNFAFSVSSRKSERVAMRPALFQRKRRLQPLTCVARHGWQRLEPSLTCQGGKGWSLLSYGQFSQAAKLPGADAVRDNSGRNRLPLAQG